MSIRSINGDKDMLSIEGSRFLLSFEVGTSSMDPLSEHFRLVQRAGGLSYIDSHEGPQIAGILIPSFGIRSWNK